MFLDSPTQTLEVSFRVKYGDGSYMVYAAQDRCVLNVEMWVIILRLSAQTAGGSPGPVASSDGGTSSALFKNNEVGRECNSFILHCCMAGQDLHFPT